MAQLSCVLWWLLMGALIGLVGSWLIVRLHRTTPPPERIVERTVEVPVERVVERVVERTVETPVDNPQLLARIASLSDEVALLPALRQRLAQAEAELLALRTPAPWVLDAAAARAAGYEPRGEDDLQIVEGIGPKIEGLLHAGGIRTFAQLAAAAQDRLHAILTEAGPNYRIADPTTWPEQAALCARNAWAELRALQDALTAGRR